jgi:polyisoprenyl-phosphate glycosyltransferase
MFNEVQVISLTLEKVNSVLTELQRKKLCTSFEIILIDDRSTDSTVHKVREFANEVSSSLNLIESKMVVHVLTKNQGQMKALETGLGMADGDVIFTLDADLQDPPELMEEMLKIYLETGISCVQAVRRKREFDSVLKRVSANFFYKLVKVICNTNVIEQAADFRLLAKKEAKLLANYPARNKAFRILIPILGIPTTTIEFDRPKRAAGKSKYKLTNQILFAWDCILNFNRFRKFPPSVNR